MASSASGAGEITRLLISWREGDEAAPDRLFSLLYNELRALARRQLRRREGDGTLSTTALVHEAYVRLVDSSRVVVKDRSHFYALACRVMRQIVVDHARQKGARKRGGDAPRLELDEGDGAIAATAQELIEIEEALKKLEALDPRMGKLSAAGAVESDDRFLPALDAGRLHLRKRKAAEIRGLITVKCGSAQRQVPSPLALPP
jgi:RNA polymerase sigma factor (TIGR02999 family)